MVKATTLSTVATFAMSASSLAASYSSTMYTFLNTVPVVATEPRDKVARRSGSNDDADCAHPAAHGLCEEEEETDAVSEDCEDECVAEAFPLVGRLTELMVSLYIPFLLESLFGGVYFIRTLILGYALNYVLQFLSVTEQAAGRWLGTAATEKGSGAWPPPALIGLGILTIVALIVHPDGYTWILLRKVRYARGIGAAVRFCGVFHVV